MTFENLNPMQIDLLKELTNIGGGNAATALSEILNRTIDMEVPTVKVLSYNKLFTTTMPEEEKVNAIFIRAMGDIPGYFLYIIKEKDTFNLMKLLIGQEISELDEIAISALQEVCNILCSSYVNALSRMLDITMIASVPSFVQDMFGAIVTSVYIEAGHIDENLLMIENYFLTGSDRIKAHLFFVPKIGSLEKIFSITNFE